MSRGFTRAERLEELQCLYVQRAFGDKELAEWHLPPVRRRDRRDAAVD